MLGLFAKNSANRETMFMFSWSMTYVVHMGHYDVYTFTLVSSMGGIVLFTFDMYSNDISNRVNSSLYFLLIKKISSFINQLPIIMTFIYHRWDMIWFVFDNNFKMYWSRVFLHRTKIEYCFMVRCKFVCIIISFVSVYIYII